MNYSSAVSLSFPRDFETVSTRSALHFTGTRHLGFWAARSEASADTSLISHAALHKCQPNRGSEISFLTHFSAPTRDSSWFQFHKARPSISLHFTRALAGKMNREVWIYCWAEDFDRRLIRDEIEIESEENENVQNWHSSPCTSQAGQADACCSISETKDKSHNRKCK